MKNPNILTVSELAALPNLEKAIAADLRLVNIHHPHDLIGKNAYKLRDQLCQSTEEKHDPCVIDVFLSIIEFMECADPRPWWKYTTERKKYLNRAHREESIGK